MENFVVQLLLLAISCTVGTLIGMVAYSFILRQWKSYEISREIRKIDGQAGRAAKLGILHLRSEERKRLERILRGL